MIRWYHENFEMFPWRRDREPYKVWLSEIMLQQTTVRTVIPYFEKFLKRFPNVETLAQSDVEEVLAHWQGLGYYRRARMLHNAAQVLCHTFHSTFPTDISAIKTLPGVGDYTAKAIASIAFNAPVVPVDGNVVRVFSRLFALKENVSILPKILTPYILAFEEGLSSGNLSSGAFAQSLMDLGREVCKPQNPTCESCPVQSYCHAFAQNIQNELPVSTPKTKIPTRYAQTTLRVNSRNEFFIEKRKFKGVLFDLWQFPTSDFISQPFLNPPESENAFYKGQIKHVFSHFKLVVDVYQETIEEHFEKGIWVTEKNLPQYALSTLMRKVLKIYHQSFEKKAA